MQSKQTPLGELKTNWRYFVDELVQQLLRPRNLVIGLVLVILHLLTACSHGPTVTVERRVLLEPPLKFLLPTPFPEEYTGTTNEDLLMYFDDWEAQLRACNTDKYHLARWVEESRKNLSETGHSESP